MGVLASRLDPSSDAYRANRAANLELLAELDRLLAQARAGGGQRYVDRHRARGKLLARERVELLLDRDGPFLELSPLAAWGTDFPVGASGVTGVGPVAGVECVVTASDPTVRGGATNPPGLRKTLRAMEIAERNRLPLVQLIESSGADLPTQSQIFIPGGAVFRNLTRLSRAGIPTLALVFGSSTAGGAYVPGLSDHTIMVRERAKVFLGGPPLVKMATGEQASDEELGGAEMHARTSGLADQLAADEHDCLRLGREVVANLGWRKLGPGPTRPPDEPLHDPEELLGLAPVDLKIPADVREILARVVDGSRFSEWKPLYGTSLCCGWASVHGYPVGVLANAGGVLFSEESNKAAHFIQLANQSSTPLLFLQNTTGYMVGKAYEQRGIIKDGAKMINAVANSAVPHLTLILGASYGAGGYGMAGRAYDPRFLFTWPASKSAVMGPEQLAGVMSILNRASAERAGRPFDDEADRSMRDAVRDHVEAESLALFNTGQLYDDGIIDPRDTRTVLGIALSACHSGEVKGTDGFGVFPDVITRLLVANRGEIATRVLRAARSMGIATVAVFADPDRDAPFVAEADEAVPLGDSGAYLRADAILDAARRTGADAVHPGYGFLSERASFAEAVLAAGLRWVGPPPKVLAALGDKLEARRVAAGAGVPVLPALPVAGPAGPGLAAEAAAQVGFPLLVKAAHGGGGIGMRVVRDPGDLAEAVAAARRQAGAAFGNDEAFLERWLESPRHVEVQLLADTSGRMVQLFERECSIQRRHQKLIEEAPSPAVDPELRRRLGEAALAVAGAVGYVGAGTVEFLLEPSGEAFWFLEVNARIQVEHPVTEAVTGLDLVRLQLLVAAGEPLPLAELSQVEVRGHAIEARLYAEDPAAGFLPQAGVLHRFRVGAGGAAGGPAVRVDAGVADGSVVGVHYDPLLAKVVAHAPTRPEAARMLASALAGAQLHGVVTNRDLLVGVLRSESFLAGDTDTGFLDHHPPAELTAAGSAAGPLTTRLHAAAAALAAQVARRAATTVYPAAPSGWRNNPSQLQRVALDVVQGPAAVLVGYRFDRTGALVALEVDGDALPGPRLWHCTADLVDLEIEGVRRQFEVQRVGDTAYVDSPLGHSELRDHLKDPASAGPGGSGAGPGGSMVSSLPGVVRRVLVGVGEWVEAGDVLVLVEAMKTEHRVAAARPGRVLRVLVAEGQEVAAGTTVVELEEAADG